MTRERLTHSACGMYTRVESISRPIPAILRYALVTESSAGECVTAAANEC